MTGLMKSSWPWTGHSRLHTRRAPSPPSLGSVGPEEASNQHAADPWLSSVDPYPSPGTRESPQIHLDLL